MRSRVLFYTMVFFALLGATGCLQQSTPGSTATPVAPTLTALPPIPTLPPQLPTATPAPQPTPEPTLTINWITPLPAPIYSLRLKGQVAYTILLDQTHIYWMVDGNSGHIFRYPLAGGEVETIATSQFADGNLDMYRPIRTGDWLIVLDTRSYDDRVWVLRALNLRDKSDTVVTQGNGSTVMRGLAADGDWMAWTLLEESASCTGTDAQTVLAVHNLKSGGQRELDRSCFGPSYAWGSPSLSGNHLVASQSGDQVLFDLTSGQRTTLTNDVSCEPTISDSWIVWTIAECGGFDTTDVVYNLQSGERRIVRGPGEPRVHHHQAGRWLYWDTAFQEPIIVYDLETDRMLAVVTPGANESFRDMAVYDNMIAWARDLDPDTAAVHDSVLEWRTLLPSQPTATSSPGATILPSVEIPTSCVAHSEDSAPYFNLTDGYCLLYPAHFRVYDVRPGLAGFYGPPLDQTIEPVFGGLSILVEGPAAGRTLAQVADHYVSVNRTGEGMAVTRSTATFGGEPAEIVEGPGGESPVGSRQVFVLHNDTVYHLGMYPVDERFPQAAPYVAAVWQAVSSSFTFLPEGFAAAFSSCPDGNDNAAPYLNLTDDYCLLYPSGLGVGVQVASHGVVLSGLQGEQDSEPVLIDLVIRAGKSANGRSVDQVVTDYLAQYAADVAAQLARTSITIGGQPGEMVDGVPGRTQTRQAFVVYNDRVYEFTLSPYNDPASQTYQAEADAAWRTVTASFVFVTVSESP